MHASQCPIPYIYFEKHGIGDPRAILSRLRPMAGTLPGVAPEQSYFEFQLDSRLIHLAQSVMTRSTKRSLLGPSTVNGDTEAQSTS